MRTIVLGPKETPLIKTYSDKDNIVSIDRYTGATEFLSASEISPHNHSILTNEKVREVLIVITSDKEIVKEDIIEIVNHTPV